MIFDEAAREELVARPWDEARVRATIDAIVADCGATLRPDGTSSLHPRDEVPAPHRSLYLGAAGVALALRQLEARGIATKGDYAELLERTHAAYLKRPDTGDPCPSLLLGETGILLRSMARARPSIARAG